MIYTFIRNNEKIFPIEKLYKVLRVGQRSYYQWKSGAFSDRKQRAELVKEKITSIYFDSKQRYGSPKITAELPSLCNKLSRPKSFARTGEAITVVKYMKELGLRIKLSKKFKVTTNSKHKYLIVPNVLNREFSVTEPSKVWVWDITYIRVKKGFIYLTTILELYEKKIIGWSLSNGMSVAETSVAA